MADSLNVPTQRTQKSSMTDWRRRLNWRLIGFRLDVMQKGTKFRVRPRYINVLAPFQEGAEIGAGASPDEAIRRTTPSLWGRLVGTNKVGRAEMADFLEAMGSAIDSGASEADALRLAVSSCRSARLRGTVAGLYLMVNSGIALSDAMGFFGTTFSSMLIALTRASESAGGKKGEV
ncbi:MAG: type II secretion system F family protein, partial [Lacunisphaera sp.]